MPNPYGGGAVRMFSQLKYLSGLGVVADLLCPLAAGERVPDEVRSYVRRIHVVPGRPDSFADRLRNLLTFSAYHEDKEFSALVSCVMGENKYDLVHAHKFQSAIYLRRVKNLPVVVDLWACGLDGAWRDFLHERSLLGKAVKLSRLPRFWAADMKLYPSFDNYFVVSEEAAGYVRERYPDKNAYLVPHGIELPVYKPDPARSGPGKDLVFVGDMAFSQNVDTVLYFAEKIYPALKKMTPGVRFYIVGRNPPPAVLALGSDKSVMVTGFVEDAGEYLRNSSVFVAPIRTGLGLRTKILEAFAYRLPVVTSRLACEGIAAEDGKTVMFAENPAEFARKTAWLLENPEEMAEIGGRARALVEEKYLWPKIAQEIKKHYEEILHNHNFKK